MLFLDEPSSGLDSASALALGRALSRLSAAGVTVVATIHQPRYEVLSLFDTLVLLVPGGHVV